jgi:xanthine dehydrogenase iron-sulfur cluster and FAD-binding subunit A
MPALFTSSRARRRRQHVGRQPHAPSVHVPRVERIEEPIYRLAAFAQTTFLLCSKATFLFCRHTGQAIFYSRTSAYREKQGANNMFESVEAFYRPSNVRETLQLLQNGKGSARIVAGCTDLLVEDGRSVRFLIDITCAGLKYIRRRGAAWAVGATTTMADLEESAKIRALAGGLLAHAAAKCGSVQNRNMATVGGNMANGSPAADLAAPLWALAVR